MKEKILKRYVIATLDNPTQYLVSLHFGEYAFTDNIVVATKTGSRSLAEELLQYYYRDTSYNVDMVIIPLNITYDLIDETE